MNLSPILPAASVDASKASGSLSGGGVGGEDAVSFDEVMMGTGGGAGGEDASKEDDQADPMLISNVFTMIASVPGDLPPAPIPEISNDLSAPGGIAPTPGVNESVDPAFCAAKEGSVSSVPDAAQLPNVFSSAQLRSSAPGAGSQSAPTRSFTLGADPAAGLPRNSTDPVTPSVDSTASVVIQSSSADEPSSVSEASVAKPGLTQIDADPTSASLLPEDAIALPAVVKESQEQTMAANIAAAPVSNRIAEQANSAGSTAKQGGISISSHGRLAGTPVAKATRGMIDTKNPANNDSKKEVSTTASSEVSVRRIAVTQPQQVRSETGSNPGHADPETVEVSSVDSSASNLVPLAMSESNLRSPGSASAQTVRIEPAFRAINEIIEKIRPEGASRMEIEVRLEGGEKLKVRLEFQNGEVRTAFQTNNVEVQSALQRGWSSFSQQVSDRGFRVGELSFESNSGGGSQTAFQNQSGSNQRRESSERPQSWLENGDLSKFGRPGRQAVAIKSENSNSSNVSLWA